MTTNIAINGMGRIGRCILRSVFEEKTADIKICAINDLAPITTIVHLLKFDTVHGRFDADIQEIDGGITINGQHIRVTQISDPETLPWQDIDIATECTGRFTAKADAGKLLQAGAKKVLISAPSKDADKTIVYGVNHETLTDEDNIVSNASCTTNCLAPLADVLQELCGIEAGYMTTIHAYTGDQSLHDGFHKDLYRARAGASSMIPTSTGAASAISLVIPELTGKLQGSAIRVPTPNVSMVDLVFTPSKAVTVAEIDAAMHKAASGKLKGVLNYDTDPKVSIDYNHTTESSHYAKAQTCVMSDKLIRVVSWYDNEWGFSNRMIDTARKMHQLSQ